MNKYLTPVTIIVIALIVIVFAPFVVIWSINTLFTTGIEYSFWTWLATLVVTSVFGNSMVSIKK